MHSRRTPKPLRALIADDEPSARRGLRILLSQHDDVEVVGECATAAELVPTVESAAPDVVFLDVRMPGGTGIEAFRDLPAATTPLVVLVTAYEEHALEAFDIEAVDYLLKPFTDEAFTRSLERVRRHLERIRAQRTTQEIADAGDGVPGAAREWTRTPGRIAVRTGRRIHLVDPADIECVDADGDYVRLHTEDGEYLLRHTMQAMENRLDPEAFVRIHRSTLVRAEAIVEVRIQPGGQAEAILRDGSRRSLSRSGQERLRRHLSIEL